MEEERERERIEDSADEEQHHRSLAVEKRRRHGRTPPESGFTREEDQITHAVKQNNNATHGFLIPNPLSSLPPNATVTVSLRGFQTLSTMI